MDNKGADGINHRLRTIALLAFAGFLWSLGGVFIKTTDAHPFVISSVRSLTAAFGTLAFLRFKPKFTFERAQIAGALLYAATLTSFVTATKLTTSANAILLQYTSPIFVALLSRLLLKSALRWFDFLSMGGVGAGLVLLMYGSIGYGSLAGNVIAVISGFFYASMMVSLKMHKSGSQVETMLLGNLAAAIFGLPFLFVYPVALTALPPVIFLGIFQIAIPYFMFAKASVRASALDLALIPVIEPLLNPLWVFLVTGEQPAPLTYVGGCILLAVVTFRSAKMYASARQT